MLGHENYEGRWRINRGHPWWTNVMNNIPRVASEEQYVNVSTDGLGKKLLLKL